MSPLNFLSIISKTAGDFFGFDSFSIVLQHRDKDLPVNRLMIIFVKC